ncbi:MAG: right-handed parallel beta-helix repeat-containing protein, partial [Verrucomicrobiae bacterium]|nr:right-handed parallel beta-helix repeat-containing protein [Verrucomicrobiae bacterium]
MMNGVAIRYNSGDGIVANRTATTITGCTASQNNGWGINCDGYGYYGDSGTAQLEDNVVQQNGGGVRIYRWISAGLVGNTISGNSGTGLELQNLSGVSASGITGNSIYDNGGVGVLIRSGGPSVLTLSGNDIYNNTGFELRNESSCTVVADGNYWGEPTNTELANGVSNLTRIYDLRDGASRAVMLTDWYVASVTGGSPGPLQSYNYPIPSVTQTVAGAIAGADTWSGKVLVIGDVTVTGSLTIEPGTEVVFEYLHDTQTAGTDTSRSELILDGGTLTAAGTAAEPITFTSSRSPKTAGDWYGIRIKGGDVTLQNCVIEYAAEGIRFEDTDTRFETYALSDTTVRYCTGYGIWTTSGQYAQPVVLDNFTVLGNSTGVRAEGPVTMTGGEVRQNTSTGVYAYQTTLVMNGVAIRYNSGDGIVA